jgi:hypothetical protein
MDSYRSIVDGIGFGLSMLAGAFVCGLGNVPAIFSHGPEENAERLVTGAIVGVFVGGFLWKVRAWWREHPVTD